MSTKIYEYKSCGTCVKALKFLSVNNIDFEKIAIREQPPTKDELLKMIEIYDGDTKKLFNTSGQDYRAKKLSGKLPNMFMGRSFSRSSGSSSKPARPSP